MARERKILFVSSNFPPVIGGSAVVYDQICSNAEGVIVALGASRDYRTGVEWGGLKAADQARNYIIHRLRYLRPPAFGAESPRWFGRVGQVLLRDIPVMVGLLLNVLALIWRYRVRVVCLGELVYGGWLVFPLRYVLGRTVLIYTHGEEISQDTENLLARRRGLFLRHAHRIIAVSLFCKGQIVSKFKIDPQKIHVINNGVNLAEFNRSEKNRGIWPQPIQGRRIILSVSRLVERKGQETLLLAMPKILALHPDAHCVVVGGGPLENHLRALAMEIGIEQHCTILGPRRQNDVVEYFRNCDVFALPCRTLADGDTEGYGLVFLEAAACGKPVVAGAAGGTVEAVADGETGLLVDGSSAEEVAAAINRLLGDPTFAAKLAEEGWRRAQEATWRSVASQFLQVCRSSDHSQRSVPSYDAVLPAKFPRDGNVNPKCPQLLVTVDVEEEFGWGEFIPFKHSVRGADALNKFHLDCRSVGIQPVYLLTYPMIVDPDYRKFIRAVLDKGEAEAGIHLHSWTAPPHWEEPNAFTSYQCNLPEHIERRKLQVLSRAFEEAFGRKVIIHRAGRWGGSERTSTILESLGFNVDLSPSTGYRDPEAGGPDFSNIDGSPFWSGAKKSVLTIPASSINYFRGPRWLSSAAFRMARGSPTMEAEIKRRGKPVRFSPENADE
ncbi:MAG: glycosyltransferase, partial [Armatimonadota bacterium]